MVDIQALAARADLVVEAQMRIRLRRRLKAFLGRGIRVEQGLLFMATEVNLLAAAAVHPHQAVTSQRTEQEQMVVLDHRTAYQDLLLHIQVAEVEEEEMRQGLAGLVAEEPVEPDRLVVLEAGQTQEEVGEGPRQ